jgi:anaerobic C4-dicarboxylate transporter
MIKLACAALTVMNCAANTKQIQKNRRFMIPTIMSQVVMLGIAELPWALPTLSSHADKKYNAKSAPATAIGGKNLGFSTNTRSFGKSNKV